MQAKVTLTERVAPILAQAADTMRRKNADYGNAWEAHGALGVFVRLADKVGRLHNLLWLGNAAQVSEGIRDTAQDLLNYAILLNVALAEDNVKGAS